MLKIRVLRLDNNQYFCRINLAAPLTSRGTKVAKDKWDNPDRLADMRTCGRASEMT
jgi:hypothetical protein